MSLLKSTVILLAGTLALLGCSGDNITEYSLVETDLPLGDRIGPVSQYGQLIAGTIDGKGHIYGSCKGVVAGEEVQVRGMSLYWSIMAAANMFYTDAGISTMVKDMKIEIVRAAIATTENWGGPASGFIKDPDKQRELIKQVVEAAIRNDIYVIIDWHSHTADEQLDQATEFFREMAETYGMYNNVIFEIFNEPTKQSWKTIKEYANKIVAAIREHSDNLILVGNPYWDQTPNSAIGNEVEDPLHNIAYTFHYYANTHSIASEGKNAERAIDAGLPIFVSEWGTGNADGKGTPNVKRNDDWQEWMDKHKLSSANWSASKISEGTAAFTAEATVDSLVYSVSGELVKSYLEKNPESYSRCSN